MGATRNALIDWLRALAILMVITVHTWSLAHISSDTYPVLATIYKYFYQCGVPLFVIISGALQLSSPIQPIGTFYKKRYARIFIPFIIWSLIVYILSIFVGKYDEIHTAWDALRCYIPYMLTNRINEAYWFVGLIAALYLITPFIQRDLQKRNRKELLWICCGFLVYMIACRIAHDLFYYRVIYFLGYYVIGYTLYREWSSLIQIKENKVIRAISDVSYMTYLMHMVFITPIYMLIGFSGETAPLWACCVAPICTSLVVLGICTTGGIIAKKILPFYHYLGIN